MSKREAVYFVLYNMELKVKARTLFQAAVGERLADSLEKLTLACAARHFMMKLQLLITFLCFLRALAAPALESASYVCNPLTYLPQPSLTSSGMPQNQRLYRPQEHDRRHSCLRMLPQPHQRPEPQMPRWSRAERMSLGETGGWDGGWGP